MTTAYSYLRFSTPEQLKGDSTNRQLRLAREYAAAHKLTLDDKLSFRDLGVSAFRGKNAEGDGHLAQFLEAVRSGLVEPGSYLLVESLDRISRQTARRALRTLEAIVDEGVTVVTLMDGREYSKQNLDEDPLALVMAIMVFIRAHEESATKSKRVRHALAAKRTRARENGSIMTAVSPAWLRAGPDGWEVLHDKAVVVIGIFEMAARGDGLDAITKALNNEGVLPLGRGQRWYRTTIFKLLNSESVTGVFQPHTMEYVDGKQVRVPSGAPIRDYYPRIISQELWEAVQAVRSTKSARGRNSGKPVENLFAGLLVCGRCGRSATRHGKGKGRTPNIVCSSAKHGGGSCTYESINYREAERLFLYHAPDIIRTAPSGEDLDAPLEEARNGVAGLEEEVDILVTQLARERTPAVRERMNVHLAVLGGQLEQARAELQALVRRAEESQGRIVRQRLEKLAAALKSSPLDVRAANALMRQAFERIVIDYEAHELVLHWRHGGESRCPYSTAAYGFTAEVG